MMLYNEERQHQSLGYRTPRQIYEEGLWICGRSRPAMRASTPCIAGRGAAEEIITDGRDGLIVDAGDRDALVAAMVRLFADPEARARFAAAAAGRVDGEFGAAALDARVRAVVELGEP